MSRGGRRVRRFGGWLALLTLVLPSLAHASIRGRSRTRSAGSPKQPICDRHVADDPDAPKFVRSSRIWGLRRAAEAAVLRRSRLLWWLTEPKAESAHLVLPLPVISTEPGVGFTAGALGRYVYRCPDEELSHVQVDLAAYGSVTGVQEYVLRTRARDMFGWNEVIDFNFEALIDPVFSYAGRANSERLTNDEILSAAYEADRFTIGPDVNYQFRIVDISPKRLPSRHHGLLRGFVGYRFEFDRFGAEPGSKLATDWPEALGTERRGVYYGGLSWDSRDNDYAPRRGGFHDVSVDTAGEWAGATRRYTRIGASFRQYQRLGTDRVVLAGLARGDFLFGDVPLVPKGEMSGLVYREGIGGLYTGRGYVRRRFQGNTKLYGSAEIRYEIIELGLFRWTITPGIKAFVDGGWVWDPDGDPGGAGAISGGGGVFFVWDRFEVLRAEVGVSPEGPSLVLVAQQSF